MLISYIKLAIAALIPVCATVILYLMESRTSFSKLSYIKKQLIIGIVFGGIAIIGNEWAINFNGVLANCRDAAPLAAGFLFGGPAGIIAGLLGGIERWLCVAWGGGTFTRVACSVSTVLAGFYAAGLRKFVIDEKRPSWLLSLIAGVIMEVFHLTMVFVTNGDEAVKAVQVVEVCAIPMITAVGLSVMLSTLAALYLSKDKLTVNLADNRITNVLQKSIIIAMLIGFALSVSFMYALQTRIAKADATNMMNQAISDTRDEINEEANKELLKISHEVADQIGSKSLDEIANEFNVSDIVLVDRNGIITESNNKNYIGFDMSSGEQSGAFMCLLNGTREYVEEYGPVSYDASIYRKFAGVATEYGFLQVGYSTEQLQSNIGDEIKRITANRHVGQDGALLVLNSEGVVMGGHHNYMGLDVMKTPAGRTLNDTEPGQLSEVVDRTADVNGIECYALYENVDGYRVIAMMPKTEVFKNRDAVKYVNAFLQVLIFAVIFALIYQMLQKTVIDNLKKVNRSLREISGGNLDEVVDVRNVSEFSKLSDDINATVDTLKQYIEEAKARIDKELEFAKSIQSSALPSVFPAFPNRSDVDIYAYMDTAKEVGGDFYDFYFSRDGVLNILIADVSGKGIPAALFMMRSKVQLKSLTDTDMPLDKVFIESNNNLCEGNDAGMFVTAWQGQVDLNTGELEYVNAGHNPPLVRKKDGSFEYLRSRAGLVLAGMEGVKYRLNKMEFEAGDTIFLYTDGVTEATNAYNELYGEERLINFLNSREWNSMEEICIEVKKDIDAFVGDAEQFDDITMLALKNKGQT